MPSRAKSDGSLGRSTISLGIWRKCIRLTARALVLTALACHGCAHVQPSERERLANPAMRFEMDPAAEGQRDSIHEITEGGTFSSAGPGNAGAGCGCN